MNVSLTARIVSLGELSYYLRPRASKSFALPVGVFSPQLLNVVRSTPPDKIIEVFVGDSPLQWTTWSKQPGVSLMGDAAHSMLPTLGMSPEKSTIVSHLLRSTDRLRVLCLFV